MIMTETVPQGKCLLRLRWNPDSKIRNPTDCCVLWGTIMCSSLPSHYRVVQSLQRAILLGSLFGYAAKYQN
jgi:hypothetical protein